MWFAIACSTVAAYASYASAQSNISPFFMDNRSHWEREQIRRKREREAEDRKIRRQALYGCALLIALAISGAYLVVSALA